MVKNPPAMQETPIQFLGREDPLEKATATHSSILAWSIPWTEKPGRLQSMGVTELDMTFTSLLLFRNIYLLLPRSRVRDEVSSISVQSPR